MKDPLLYDIPETIESDRLILRCPKAGDGSMVYEAIAESIQELRRFLASVPWVAAEQSVESSEIYCRNSFANFAARKDMPYLVFERGKQKLVACVGLHRPNWQTPKFEVGYWCRTSQSGQGYVTEAVRSVVQMAEDTLGAVRIELITDAENLRSRAIAERTGFVLEGLLKNERRAPDGKLCCTCIYART
jgi:RimJ/RimL family protein N-acetyltransferase